MESNMDSVQQNPTNIFMNDFNDTTHTDTPVFFSRFLPLSNRLGLGALSKKHRQEWETRITQLSALSSRLETETKNLPLGMKFQT